MYAELQYCFIDWTFEAILILFLEPALLKVLDNDPPLFLKLLENDLPLGLYEEVEDRDFLRGKPLVVADFFKGNPLLVVEADRVRGKPLAVEADLLSGYPVE